MADIDEQRKKVEELKRKILEQKKKGDGVSTPDLPVSKPVDVVQEKPVPAQSQVQEIKQPVAIVSPPRTEETPLNAEKIVVQQKVEEKPHAGVEKTAPVQPVVSVGALQAYVQALKQAWANGSLSPDEESLLLTLRKSMGISNEEHVNLEQEIHLEIYLNAIVDCWKNGSLTPQDSDRLDALREKFKISAEEHMRLEKQVRHEILKQH
jgi:anti-sigma28 factor (negative regulator of flagellin synthesis)